MLSNKALKNLFKILPNSRVTISKTGIVLHATDRVRIAYAEGRHAHLVYYLDDQICYFPLDYERAFKAWFTKHNYELETKSRSHAETDLSTRIYSLGNTLSASPFANIKEYS